MDLPGTGDTNAARGSVAEGYLKRCNAIWIVSPIIRAVNEEAAKARPLPAAPMTLGKDLYGSLLAALMCKEAYWLATSFSY